MSDRRRKGESGREDPAGWGDEPRSSPGNPVVNGCERPDGRLEVRDPSAQACGDGRLLSPAANSLLPQPRSAYLHIPFCRKRCHFCYFRVYTDKNASEIMRYIDSAIEEIRLYSQKQIGRAHV